MKTDGILLVDKELGWTSFDVVAKVRNILKLEIARQTGVKQKVKVGHTGTLDPLATGLMIIVVGSYCKRASEFSKLNKTYEVSMKLGEVSATGDAEGDIKAVSNRQPTRQEVQTTLQSFVGEDMQTPPAYSALKINGQPAYKLVRAGQDVVLDPRPVTIHSINVTKYDYPFVEFTTEVSSGTYIRSLVSDAGDKLGTGAYMSGLRRTEVGSFRLNNACLVADTSIAKLIQA